MPCHFGAIAGMGHAYTQMGELSRALTHYRKALAINPRMPAIIGMIQRLEERQRDNDASGVFVTH